MIWMIVGELPHIFRGFRQGLGSFSRAQRRGATFRACSFAENGFEDVV